MAKRKNPLQDIDAFLSQEASNLVTPNKVSEDKTVTKKESTPIPVEQSKEADDIQTSLQMWINNQGEDFRSPLYDLMLTTLENVPSQSAKDKMLINTLLYLKNPDSWKEVIKKYWNGSES